MIQHSQVSAHFSKQEFNQLAQIRDLDCISIYLSSCEGTKAELDIQIQNCLDETYLKVSQFKEICSNMDTYLRPLELLLQQGKLWQNSVPGMAIFLCKEEFKYYRLPFRFDYINYVSDHFYLKPLIPFFQKNEEIWLDQFRQANNSPKLLTGLDKIILASYDARVDTLFLESSMEVYGLCDIDNRNVLIDPEKNYWNCSLINFAAVRSIRHGGNVLLFEQDELPLQGVRIAALLKE